MAFKAKPHENILFPVPFAENEEHPVIITNLRIVQRSDAGESELETREIGFVGRSTVRPRLPIGVMLLALALPLIGVGAWQIYSVWGMTAASPLSLVGIGDDGQQPAADTPPPPDADGEVQQGAHDVLIARAIGVLCLAAALGCLIGARRLIKSKRFYVMCRTANRLMRIVVKDEIQQTQVMVTISAVKGKSLKVG